MVLQISPQKYLIEKEREGKVMKEFRMNFNLEVWVEDYIVRADTLEEAKRKVRDEISNCNHLSEVLEQSAYGDWTLSDIDGIVDGEDEADYDCDVEELDI